MKKGNKPSFHQSASGPTAKELYQAFFKKVQDSYQADKVKDGLFAAMMDVALVNDGPVGIDYSCLDNEVHPQQPDPLPLSKGALTRLGHHSNRHRPTQVDQQQCIDEFPHAISHG